MADNSTKPSQAKPTIKDELLHVLVIIDRQKPAKAARDRCPVRALMHWLEIAEITEELVFLAAIRQDHFALHSVFYIRNQ